MIPTPTLRSAKLVNTTIISPNSLKELPELLLKISECRIEKGKGSDQSEFTPISPYLDLMLFVNTAEVLALHCIQPERYCSGISLFA